MRRFLLIATLVAAALTQSAMSGHAQQPPPVQHQVAVMGIGLARCSTWRELHQVDAGSDADQWIFGFLSGVAVAGRSGFLSPSNLADVLKRLDTYCTEKPTDALAVAAVEIAKQLGAENVPGGK